MHERVKMLVDALRSGKYAQGKGRLREGDTYCCLGVACELFRTKTGKGKWIQSDEPIEFTFVAPGDRAEGGVLPRTVQQWFGCKSRNGDVNPANCLSSLNDKGSSFVEIADIIEKHHDEIFVEPSC